jgi:hypothetical protein
MPFHILFCTDVCSNILFLRMRFVRILNLIWIQMNLQIIKRFENSKAFLFSYKAVGRNPVAP